MAEISKNGGPGAKPRVIRGYLDRDTVRRLHIISLEEDCPVPNFVGSFVTEAVSPSCLASKETLKK